MKFVVFFAAICIFALVTPQTYAEEEDEPAVREARNAKGVCLNYEYKYDIVIFTRFINICYPSRIPRWQVDKEAIDLSRVHQCSSTCNPPS